MVDFLVCLGGDGVILHASSLFRRHIPPVVSFHLGSMGFLTNHPYTDYRHDLRQVRGRYIRDRQLFKKEGRKEGRKKGSSAASAPVLLQLQQLPLPPPPSHGCCCCCSHHSMPLLLLILV